MANFLHINVSFWLDGCPIICGIDALSHIILQCKIFYIIVLICARTWRYHRAVFTRPLKPGAEDDFVVLTAGRAGYDQSDIEGSFKKVQNGFAPAPSVKYFTYWLPPNKTGMNFALEKSFVSGSEKALCSFARKNSWHHSCIIFHYTMVHD